MYLLCVTADAAGARAEAARDAQAPGGEVTGRYGHSALSLQPLRMAGAMMMMMMMMMMLMLMLMMMSVTRSLERVN